MKSLLASVRTQGGLDRVDHAVQWLEDEWRKHGEGALDRLWTDQKGLFESNEGESIVLLAELIKTDLVDAGMTLLRDAADAMRLSARSYHRVLRVARTLADLDGADAVGRVHLAEALSYRTRTDDLRRAA